jgi:23S rRNA pseudouridine2605 synthase
MTKRSPKNGPAHGEQAQRINRILSLAGITSRRKADDWIKSGRVTVNGRLLNEPGTKATWGIDRICVDGQEIPNPSARLYLLLNKPFGYMSSLSDPQGRPLVTDLLTGVPQRVYPVGRLDFDTLGLLFFTNDGEWAHRMTHPRFQVPRTYKVTVPGIINDESVALLRKGVQLPDGSMVRSKTSVITRNARQSLLRMTITEGKSRQVRKMVEAVGHSVVHLIRTGFGKITLGDLKVGEYRHLETVEVESMKQLVGLV